MAKPFKKVDVEFPYGELKRTTTSNGRFYVTPEGNRYPSVTTVTGLDGKEAIQEWRSRVGDKEANRVSHHASVRGTKVHKLMEDYVEGKDIDVNGLLPLYKPSFLKLKNILDERLSEWYVQEKMLYSDHLGLAGQMDLGGRFDGVRSVVDFKTSSKVKKKEWISNYFIQETAYSIMFEERTGIPLPNLVIIMDIDNNEPIVFKEHRDNWVKPLFKAIDKYHKEMRCRPL